jgi:hypothetical protein
MEKREENQAQAIMVLKLLNTAQKDLLVLATGTTEDGKEVWVRIAEYLQTATETAQENAD